MTEKQSNDTVKWVAVIAAVVIGCSGVIWGVVQNAQSATVLNNQKQIEANRQDIRLNAAQIIDLRMQSSIFNERLAKILEKLENIEKELKR